MKQVIVANFAYIYPAHNWLKPLNPILGETYQSYTTDGSFVYMEQICHHPPISYINFEGPENLFRFHGYTNFAVKARLNNIQLEVGGMKTCQFADGSKISFNNVQDTFQNTLMGTCHHILHGDFEFKDETNGLRGIVNVGSVYRRPRDYMTGYIEKYDEETGKWNKVCKEITGTYMGYMDFDGDRLFDIRQLEDDLEHKSLPLESVTPLCLQSDSRHRSDLQELHNGNTDAAQENKHLLEVA